MEKKKLLELAKQLNGLVDDDGNALASTKVKVVAVSDDKLKASFLDACESIPEEKEGLIPDEISDAYNEIIKDDPREGQKEEAEAEEEKVEEETKPTPKKKTETKEKETKTKDKPVASKNAVAPSKVKTSTKKEETKDEKKEIKLKDKKQDDKLRDEYGFIKGTVKSNFIKSIKEKPGTMTEICSRAWNINKKPQGGYFKEFEKMGIAKRENGIISFIKK